MSMTREEAILLSAYTGFLLAPDFSEVHKFCEDTLGRLIWTHEFADSCVQKEIQEKLRPQIMELIQNIAALRPIGREQELEAENEELKERIINWRKYMAPTREQVEKVWRGCRSCKGCRSCVYSIHDLKDMPCKKCDPNAEGIVTEYKPSNFCPVCGKPLTDEAVEMVMERL